MLAYALLVRVKGTAVTPEDVHDAWVVWMSRIDATHASLIPFAELNDSVQQQDVPFANAIRVVAERHEHQPLGA